MNVHSLKRSLIGTLGILSLLVMGQAHAGLIGLSSSTPGQLYDIDTSTGAATPTTTLTDGVSFTGIDIIGGTLYATDLIGPSGFGFGSVDMTTGAVTYLNATQDGSSNWWGLAGDDSAGVLYTVDRDNGNLLKSIDPLTGITTTIGATGISDQGAGLAFDDVNSILYALGFDANLYSLSLTTGASTLIGSTGLSFTNVHQGLAFDNSTGILYMNEADTYDSLFTIDLTTGLATMVGSNGPVAGFGIDGLAFSAVPEPGTLALLGLGLFGMGLRRNRKA